MSRTATVTLPADIFEQFESHRVSARGQLALLSACVESKRGFAPGGVVNARQRTLDALVRRHMLVPARRFFGSVELEGYEIPLMTRGTLR